MIKTKLGALVSSKDIHNTAPEITTPQYKLYEDEFETHKHVPDTDDDVNPETGDGLKSLCPMVEPNDLEKLCGMQGIMMASLLGLNTTTQFLILTPTVKFPVGEIGEYSTNIIVQNVLSQCNPDGNEFFLKEAIVDHKVTDEALLNLVKCMSPSMATNTIRRQLRVARSVLNGMMDQLHGKDSPCERSYTLWN